MYRWLWKALGWLLICIVLPIGFAYGGVMGILREVPDVRGMSANEAVTALERSGFRSELYYTKNDMVPAGMVLGQAPRRGRIPKGLTVGLDISEQYRFLRVPNIVGLPMDEACRMLEETGFRWVCSESFSSKVKEGVVISQKFAPGDMVKERHQFHFTVSKGPETVVVPDVEGLSVDRARVRIVHYGLKYAVREFFHDTVKAGKVFNQSYHAGQQVERGTKVILEVSKGPDLRTVPSLVGMQPDWVEWKLNISGFGVKYIWQYTDCEPGGVVTAQYPDGGSKLRRNGEVTVTVSVPYGFVPVPDVTGMTRAQAEKTLSDAGLALSYMQGGDSKEYPGQAKTQFVKACSIAKKGSKVPVIFYKNPQQAQVPEVTGMCTSCAVKELKKCGFGAEIVYMANCSGQCGKVVTQQFRAGTWAPVDTAVYLMIGYCCGEVLMPDVRGMTLDEACAELAACGLKGERSTVRAADYARDTVCLLSVSAGTPVKKGSTVTLYLNAVSPSAA